MENEVLHVNYGGGRFKLCSKLRELDNSIKNGPRINLAINICGYTIIINKTDYIRDLGIGTGKEHNNKTDDNYVKYMTTCKECRELNGWK